jgi:hypothetical protein
MIEQAPGVATMTSTPLRKACSCGPMPTPPNTAAAVDRRVDREVVQVLEDLRRELARRRDDQRARRPARLAISWLRIGRQEGDVLPLPVMAQARTSRPSTAGGMASAWIGVGRGNRDLYAAKQIRVELELAEGHPTIMYHVALAREGNMHASTPETRRVTHRLCGVVAIAPRCRRRIRRRRRPRQPSRSPHAGRAEKTARESRRGARSRPRRSRKPRPRRNPG